MAKCFVLTGCTAGLGLALIKKLVSIYPNGHFIIICRNINKAHSLLSVEFNQIKKSDGTVNVVFGDNGDLSSIFSCCMEIGRLASKIDAIYLNAGTMGQCSLDFNAIIMSFLRPWQLPYKLSTGDGLLKYQSKSKTNDGFQTVFQSNVLSHYVIIRELEHLLSASCIVWTSSNTAQRSLHDSDDIQGFNSPDPYGGSKYLINCLSGSLNRKRFGKSYVCDPGTFKSNISLAMVPWYLSFLMVVFFKLLQPFSPKLTGDAERAVSSLLHVFQNRKDPIKTGDVKYESRVSMFGIPYTKETEIDTPTELCNTTWESLNGLYLKLKLQHK